MIEEITNIALSQQYDDMREESYEECSTELEMIKQEKDALKDKDWDAYVKDEAARRYRR